MLKDFKTGNKKTDIKLTIMGLTKEEILEGNKLIADFMGAKYKKDVAFGDHMESNQIWLPIHGINRYDTIELGKGHVLQYHKSYDWLMPVVERIEAIFDDFHGYFAVYISSNNCSIQGTKLRTGDSPHYAYFSDHTEESKLKAVYKAVIQFIKWYNLNKQ